MNNIEVDSLVERAKLAAGLYCRLGRFNLPKGGLTANQPFAVMFRKKTRKMTFFEKGVAPKSQGYRRRSNRRRRHAARPLDGDDG